MDIDRLFHSRRNPARDSATNLAVANPSGPHRQSQSNAQRAAFTSQRRQAVRYKWEEKEKSSERLWHSLAPRCTPPPFLPTYISPSIHISDGLFGKAVQPRRLFYPSPLKLKTSEGPNDRWWLQNPNNVEDNRKLSHLPCHSFFLSDMGQNLRFFPHRNCMEWI